MKIISSKLLNAYDAGRTWTAYWEENLTEVMLTNGMAAVLPEGDEVLLKYDKPFNRKTHEELVDIFCSEYGHDIVLLWESPNDNRVHKYLLYSMRADKNLLSTYKNIDAYDQIDLWKTLGASALECLKAFYRETAGDLFPHAVLIPNEYANNLKKKGIIK